MDDEVFTGPGDFLTGVGHAPDLRRGVFVPALLLALALVGWLGFQFSQLWFERQQLASVQQSLDPQEAAAKKVRLSLESVATSTAKLANDGNANARVIVEELRKRGVTINTPAGPKTQ